MCHGNLEGELGILLSLLELVYCTVLYCKTIDGDITIEPTYMSHGCDYKMPSGR